MNSPHTAPAAGEGAVLGLNIRFTAISVTCAFGCGGWEPYDQVDGSSVFVKPGHISDADLDALEERLDILWPPKRGGSPHDSAIQAVAELGVELPSAEPSVPPVWGPAFSGTLQDWVAAAGEHAALQRETDRAWKQTFAHARQRLLLHEGFTPAEGLDATMGRALVSDYGCLCGCYSGSDGEANLVLSWRTNEAYTHPVDVNLDAVLARLPELEAAGVRGCIDANIKACEQLSVQGHADVLDVYLDRYRLERDPDNPALTMTWAEWDAARAARKTTLLNLSAQAQTTGNWEAVCAHVKAEYGRDIYDPAVSGQRKANSYLSSCGVKRRSAAEALSLWTALSDTPPPEWLTGQAAAEPLPTGIDRAGRVVYKPVPGATGSFRIMSSGTGRTPAAITQALGGEDPDIPSVEAE